VIYNHSRRIADSRVSFVSQKRKLFVSSVTRFRYVNRRSRNSASRFYRPLLEDWDRPRDEHDHVCLSHADIWQSHEATRWSAVYYSTCRHPCSWGVEFTAICMTTEAAFMPGEPSTCRHSGDPLSALSLNSTYVLNSLNVHILFSNISSRIPLQLSR